jgi:hypothetical protein
LISSLLSPLPLVSISAPHSWVSLQHAAYTAFGIRSRYLLRLSMRRRTEMRLATSRAQVSRWLIQALDGAGDLSLTVAGNCAIFLKGWRVVNPSDARIWEKALSIHVLIAQSTRVIMVQRTLLYSLKNCIGDYAHVKGRMYCTDENIMHIELT